MKDPSNARNRAIYIARINQVIDYIEAHLEGELTLEGLARVASFSPYHFHRLFKYFMGETLNNFIQRLRLEKAAAHLVKFKGKSITDIAFDSGFSGSSSFARAFRDYFEMSASQYREKFQNTQKDGINDLKNHPGEEFARSAGDFKITSCFIDNISGNPTWKISLKQGKDIMVEVKEMPEMEVAYVRYIGPYKGDTDLFDGLFSRLFKWAIPRGLHKSAETKILSVYHDDPGITDDENLRVSVCITIPPGTNVDGEMGKMIVPGGTFAVGHFKLNGDQFEEAWTTLMAGWLPESGYQPDNGFCYELCLNDPKGHPEQKHIVDICVPVKPL